MLSTLICVAGIANAINDPILELELEMSKREWTPPETTLPAEFVKAAQFLFRNGMADPSGGQLSYVRVENKWQFESSVAIGGSAPSYDIQLGWVIEAEGVEQPLIVGLDGLLYVASSVSNKAKSSALLGAKPALIGNFNDPGLSVVALLLKSGDIEAAEGLFSFLTSNQPERRSSAGDRLKQAWVQHAVSARMNQGIDAFKRKDDHEAYRHFYSVTQNADMWRSVLLQGRTIESLGYAPLRRASQARMLSEDLHRRLVLSREPFDELKLRSLPTSNGIEYCIEFLDESRLAGFWSTGAATVGDNVPVSKLAQYGDEAIPYLLQVAETDTRFARETHDPFSRRIGQVDTVVEVKRIALEALEVLMFGALVGTPEEKLAQAKVFWEQYKSNAPMDRLMLFLQDEDVSIEQKLRATRWVSDYALRYDETGKIESFDFRDDPSTKRQAEELRKKQNPSYSETLIRLIQDESRSLGGGRSSDLAVHLYKWSVSDALASLKLASEKTEAKNEQLMANLARIACARDSLGDPDAFKEYASAIEEYDFKNPFRYEIVAPIALYSSNPHIQAVTNTVVLDEQSVWHPSNLHRPLGGREIRTHLLAVPQFQDTVFSILDDQTEIGGLKMIGLEAWLTHIAAPDKPRRVAIKLDLLSEAVRLNEPRTLRQCDSMAYVLSGLAGAPEFSPFWSREKRDEAIKQIRDYVIKNSETLTSMVDVSDTGRLPDYFGRK